MIFKSSGQVAMLGGVADGGAGGNVKHRQYYFLPTYLEVRQDPFLISLSLI